MIDQPQPTYNETLQKTVLMMDGSEYDYEIKATLRILSTRQKQELINIYKKRLEILGDWKN